MANQDETRLLRLLGCEHVSPTPARVGARQAEPPFDADAVQRMRDALIANPDAMMPEAPALLGSAPEVEDALRLLNSAESALRNARGTAIVAEANLSEEAFELPPEHRFPGYDHEAIPIFPNRTQFETVADAPAWAVTAAAAWFFRLATPKPPLPTPSTNAVYPLIERDDATTVALFADWGTGYYHSRYIATHIERLRVAQAIHLGDVYYIGSQSQFDAQVEPVLEPLLREMPVYLMNANHEMDSHGIPYLGYLRHKSRLGQQKGFAAQPQETSYFCLVNDSYQVIGIDTAYYGAGRYANAALRAWLEARLEEGRTAQRTTILLSQNEPYAPGRGGGVGARQRMPLLDRDLLAFVAAGLIHAWFWGDEHYTALYEPNDQLPFVGSCIGYAGYPFGKERDDSREDDVVRLHWAETASRFDGIPGLRQDRGNNGFCHLTLNAGHITLRYIDWRFRTRLHVTLRSLGGRLRIEADT
jgi:hypothetical protein